MQYYIIINGAQMGPYNKEELRLQGLSPDSMVWRPGLEGWVAAAALSELAELITPAYTENINEQPYVPPVPPTGPAGSPQSPYNYKQPAYNPNPSFNNPGQNFTNPPTNWMPWAIVATVVGFCTSCIGGILGIIAIVNANKANNFFNMGMFDEGYRANSSAKTLTIISLVLDALGIIGTISYFSFIGPSLNLF